MIVITNPTAVDNEINHIHSLFDNGLRLLHVRKPDYSETSMIALLTAIGNDYSNQLVLHSHHHLAEAFGITRLHNPKTGTDASAFSFSIATHSIEEFNALHNDYDYAFLSPVYPSISKPNYQSQTNLLTDVKHRTNWNTKLIALGGIALENISETLQSGFDEVALLGYIWNSSNPLESFKKCQQIAHSF
ncbi:thiamine phosphate synthase [Flavobacterium sp. GCM10027622]|uniref:thiamine phosphate synthase n=1 Tax=unclassified Flavobacterium TaxID=196869 RepID=UPI00360D5EFF